MLAESEAGAAVAVQTPDSDALPSFAGDGDSD